MPRPRTSRKPAKKKAPYKKKYNKKRNYKKSNQLRILKSPIPENCVVALNYFTRVRIDPNSTGSAGTGKDNSMTNYVFSINNVYDPDYTAGVLGTTFSVNKGDRNHQPYGFDQWSPFFRTFRVIGATASVNWFNQNLEVNSETTAVIDQQTGTTSTAWANSHNGVFVGLHLDDELTLPDDIHHAIEDGRFKFKTLMPGQRCNQTIKYSMKKGNKLFKPSRRTQSSGDIETVSYPECHDCPTVGQSPVAQRYLHLIVNGLSPIANIDVPPIDAMVKIRFLVNFRDRIEIVQS